MKIQYYAETDSLYIELSTADSSDSQEVSDGVVLDYDQQGNIVGIDIDRASEKLDITQLTLSKIPANVKFVA
jgi:uncharacterized protein YuzE